MSKPDKKCYDEKQINITINNSIYEQIFYCNNCQGINLKNKNEEITTSITLFKKEQNFDLINPLFLYEKMRKFDKNISLKYDNNYYVDRKEVVIFITKLVNKYKLSEDTFFLAILYLDQITSKMIKYEIELDLLAMGCFFLAGKISF